MGLSGSSLKLDDTAIQQYVNMSSIRRLSGYSSQMFPSLLRGNKSLGWYMQNRSLDALPSPNFPLPEGGYTYFGATKSPITIQYSTDSSDVIQAECHSDNRLTKKSRNIFGNKFAEAIVDFYNEHYGKFNPFQTMKLSIKLYSICAINSKWYIVYSDVSLIITSPKNICLPFEIDFSLPNSAEPNEMLLYATFHQFFNVCQNTL